MALNLPPPPIQSPVTLQTGQISPVWVQWFQVVFNVLGPLGVIPITSGGTGAITAAAARINLGLDIGVNVQAFSSNLNTWSTKTAPSGTVVGTTDAQTLTNKTLNTPSITTPGVSGGTFTGGTFNSPAIVGGMASGVAITTGSATGLTALSTSGNKIIISTSQTPASASAAGTTGTICWDANFIYVCVATNTWVRVATATW